MIMNLFDNMHGLKGCIRCLTFKNVLLAHFLLAFSVAGSVSAEALPTSYLNGIEQQSRKVAGRVLQRVDNEPVIGANIVVTGQQSVQLQMWRDVSLWTTCRQMPVRLPYLLLA